MPRDWLETMTEHNSAYWLGRVQALIRKHTRPTDDPNHGETDTGYVIRDLTVEVISSFPPDEKYDGNMRTFACLSHVMGLWYARTHLAKSRDPRRPVSLRRRTYRAQHAWSLSMVSMLLDESRDPTYYPDQSWELPFSPDATNGTFI